MASSACPAASSRALCVSVVAGEQHQAHKRIVNEVEDVEQGEPKEPIVLKERKPADDGAGRCVPEEERNF
jgi:hypothetical protein